MEDTRPINVPSELIPTKILIALIKAQRLVVDVFKTKFVPTTKDGGGKGYMAAEGESVIEAGLNALQHKDVGLGVIQLNWRTNSTDGTIEREDKWGNITLNYTIFVEYMLFSEQGEAVVLGPYTTPVVVGAGKPADKAEAGALTYNYSYFMRGLLGITRFEESGKSNDKRTEQLSEKNMGWGPDDRDDRDYQTGPARNHNRAKPPAEEPKQSAAFQELARLNKENPIAVQTARQLYEKEHGKPPSRSDETSLYEVISLYKSISAEPNI